MRTYTSTTSLLNIQLNVTTKIIAREYLFLQARHLSLSLLTHSAELFHACLVLARFACEHISVKFIIIVSFKNV